VRLISAADGGPVFSSLTSSSLIRTSPPLVGQIFVANYAPRHGQPLDSIAGFAAADVTPF
jgi:hypothetical protein